MTEAERWREEQDARYRAAGLPPVTPFLFGKYEFRLFGLFFLQTRIEPESAPKRHWPHWQHRFISAKTLERLTS